MFPHKIFKRVLKEKFPNEQKPKLLGFIRYTSDKDGFDGTEHDPYFVYAFRVGNSYVTIECLSSLSWVSVDNYNTEHQPLFCLSFSYNAK